MCLAFAKIKMNRATSGIKQPLLGWDCSVNIVVNFVRAHASKDNSVVVAMDRHAYGENHCKQF